MASSREGGVADSARRTWSRLSSRERVGAVTAAAVVLAGLGWTLLWQPLAADRERLDRELPALRAGVAVAREHDAEAQGLRRQSPPVRTGDLGAALERALVARGLRTVASDIDIKASQVRFTLASVDLAALAALLDSLAREEALFPVEMTLTARVEPGLLRAEVTLAREPAQ
jgi:general secretion pathway protein M